MRWLIVIILLIQGVSAQESGFYTPQVDFSIQDFLGECDSEKVGKLDMGAIGECSGNFFNPAIPNPLHILTPFNGENIKLKLDTLFTFVETNSEGLLSIISSTLVNLVLFPLRFLVLLLSSLVELILSIVKFLLVFTVRFMFVYLVYVSMAFQAFFKFAGRGDIYEQIDKVNFTVLIMVFGSIVMLAVGGGWVIW